MKNTELIKAFKQGKTGNCVSIAVIKAAIEIFGLGNVFHFENNPDGGFSYLMKDGFSESVSKEELEIAIENSFFVSLESEEIYNYANVCFAAMAKRAFVEGNDNKNDLTYIEAIETLNDGEYYLHGAHWLGLKHNYRNIGRKYTKNNPGCVGASKAHCFYVSYGIADNYGVVDKVSFFERRFVRWYRITDQQHF